MSKKAIPEFVEDASAPLHGARWRFDAFELDERRRELSRAGELILIEPKPLNLLMLMLRHPGQLVTKNDLIETLWAGRIVTEAVLGNCVTKLRAALGEPLAGQLKTVHGYGYRFDVQAELIADREAEAAPPKLQFEAGAVIAQRPNWRLVRRLGLSGDSWLAEHVKTRARRVFKFTNDLHGLSALKREVTIYRLLRESLGDSARYVDILDWNFDAPPWFTESEYCAGGSLQEWFEAQGGVAKVPLPLRLELIAQIADAIADIHAHGVLHKDLKPANVFVVPGSDGTPTIRLADFGSGRLMDVDKLAALQITRMGFTQVIDTNPANTGTPLYLAPEVLDGFPPTLKADIYALGVMLYQCVVGNLRRPLATGWEQGVDDEMLRDDIATAAEGNPERRLANAAELARNLRSIEQRRTVRIAEREAQARLERETRALERMRARRVGLIAAFVALTVGLVTSAYLYLEARQAKLLAEAEARRAIAVSDFLSQDVLATVNSGDRSVKNLTIKEVLDPATQKVSERFADQPAVASKVYRSLGKSYQALEYYIDARSTLEKGLALVEAEPAETMQAVGIAGELVYLDFMMGKLPETIDRYDQIERRAQAAGYGDDPSLLELRTSLARGRVQLGQWQMGADELRSVLDTASAHGGADPETLYLLERSLGYVLDDLGRYAEATTYLESAARRARQVHGDRHITYARARLRIGRIYAVTGRYEEAEAELNGALSIALEWGKSDSGDVLGIRLYLAQLRFEQGRYADAAAILEDILRTTEAFKDLTMDQAWVQSKPLAEAYQRMGRLGDAEARMRIALASILRSLGPGHVNTRAVRIALADILRERGKADEATATLDEPEALSLADLPNVHPLQAALARVRGLILATNGDAPRARAALNESASIYAACYGKSHPIYQRAKRELMAISEPASEQARAN